jgi:iron complex outermembrane receptor protein
MNMKALFFFIITIGIVFSNFSVNAQACKEDQEVRVIDGKSGNPLPGASLLLSGRNKAYFTNSQGAAAIDQLCEAISYTLQVRYIGYMPLQVDFTLRKGSILEISLSEEAIGLAAVVVEGTRNPAPTKPTEQLSGLSLQQTRGKSLGESLKGLPGLNSLQTGPGISKPVIQGLHSNRILILNNGIRLEGQQWGAEHAPEIDPFIANKITVIKGAEGVRYGPDAIGGVIILEPNELNISRPLEGEINIAGSSNGRMGVASAILSGSPLKAKDFNWRAQITGKRGGDFHTPDYGLMNTGIRELNYSVAAAINKPTRNLEVFFSQFSTEVGIMRSAHIGNVTDLEEAIQRDRPFYVRDFTYSIDNPRQELSHSLIKVRASQLLPKLGVIEIKYGGQWNDRKEFDIRRGGRSERAAIDMSLTTHSLDLTMKHKPLGDVSGEIGLTGMYQQNRNIPGTGVSPLIPFFNQASTGVYVIEKYVKPSYEIEFGARYDYRNLEVKTFDALDNLVNPILNFRNAVFTLGGQFDLTEHWKFSTNVGSAWRPPHVSELFSNGLHHGVAAIERGLFYPEGFLVPEAEILNIKSENSYKWVNELAYQGARFRISANPYLQHIENFIYLQPDPGSYLLTIRGSFPVASYKQTDAFLYGLDVNAGLDLPLGLSLTGSYSMVRARDLIQDNFIIWMPADQIRGGINKTFTSRLNPFLSLGFLHVAQQTRVDAEADFAPPPAAYQLFSLSGGFSIPSEEHHWNVFLQAENLLNQRFRDYMNRLRYYADDMGRNISLRVQYQF